MARRHLNECRRDVVLNAHVESVLQHGVINEVRSCAWGPRPGDADEGWALMGFGTLAMAVYKATLKEGIKGSI
eukprot:7063621-Alexandrium_andersonii.AAC.1